ncbi:MAG: helix-turn-helix domain-containing protein [Pseudomonadota bacterium]
MSELQMAAGGEGAAFPDTAGAGAQLRAAREAQGVHIASLAVALKVPVSRLEALEADRFDLLPDPPFVRALAGSVCRALKLDPAPVLARLPQKVPPRLNSEAHSGSPRFRSPGARKPVVGEQLSHPVVWWVLLLLVAAGALIMLPSERLGAWVTAAKEAVHDRLATPAASTSAETAPPVAAEPPVAGTAEAPAPAVAVALSGASTPPTPAMAGAPADTPAAAVVPAEGDGLLVLKASAESWVKVTDARGTVVLQKAIPAGGSESVTGTPPLAVVVGRADATQVLVRGQPFDMTALARSNVARFEVK